MLEYSSRSMLRARQRLLGVSLFAAAACNITAGCTADNPAYCDEDKLCIDPSTPFCDLRGNFGPANTCIPTPPIDAGTATDASADASTSRLLEVFVEGAGAVSSDPDGIDCGSTCSAEFPPTTMVTLTATSTAGFRFVSWAGDCSGDTPTCVLVLDEPRAVTAHFAAIKVIDIAVGFQHSCAVLDTGAARCWGEGGNGQLGQGAVENIGDDELPADVNDIDVGGNVVQITVGMRHTCALLDTKTVRCWGDSTFGQLGYGNTEVIGDNEAPSSAGDVDVGGPVKQIAAGFLHTCALLETGAVRCWGNNGYGQLGYGNTTTIGDTEPPSSAGDVAVGGTAIRLAAGGQHTCAVLDTGAVRCWGNGAAGQLGYGNTTPIGDDEPVSSAGDVDLGRDATHVATGFGHTCARTDIGGVVCWGFGNNGRLGYGNTDTIGDTEPPTAAGLVDAGRPVIQIAAGDEHSCARLDTNEVRCWGNGAAGRLGYGDTASIGDTEVPAAAGPVDVGDEVEKIAAGSAHTCALLLRGAVRCWGSGGSGRLGYGNTDDIGDDETPASAGDVPLF